MAAKIPIPETFREIAPRHTMLELMEIFGVSMGTVNNWARRTGARTRGTPNRRGSRRREDSPAQIAACLSCPRLQCNPTYCRRLLAAGRESR